MSALDSIFISTEHWLAGLAPAGVRPLVSMLLIIAGLMALFGTCFALATILERKTKGVGTFSVIIVGESLGY